MPAPCRRLSLILLTVSLISGFAATQARATHDDVVVRVAQFNIWELSRGKLDEVDPDNLGTNTQLKKSAEIVQRVRPDILLINEIDFDEKERINAALFQERYLAQPQLMGLEPIEYAHSYFAPVNTGVRSGHDLDHNGKLGDPADAWGYGRYPGQYGMALFSKHPIDTAHVRTFQTFRWADMPHHNMPDGEDGRPAWYAPDIAKLLPLSSKSHWDIPVRIHGRTIHLLCAHPTPPVFDGDEDRNGRRNYDEIRLWADYIAGGDAAAYIVDDAGKRGGLRNDASFIVLGDLNADPVRGDLLDGKRAIDQLLSHPRIEDPRPRAAGGAALERDYPGDKATRTAGFGRLDYVLPSRDLPVAKSGVFWPGPDSQLARLASKPDPASDHHLVWVDIRLDKPSHANEHHRENHVEPGHSP